MGNVRASLILLLFFLLSLPLMPVQALLVRAFPMAARALPHWYHRRICRLLGVRIHALGTIPIDKPVLIVANHTSWLDIPVLSAVAPVSFVAKSEVGGWPFVGTLARLQRTVFVDRTRRAAVGSAADTLAARLAQGDRLVLFAEGTSSDGNRVLPFMSSLFAAVSPARPPIEAVSIVPLALAYTARNGVRLGRQQRPAIGWYGDMEMTSHAWGVLRSGPIDVEIRIGEPIVVTVDDDRKALAATAERHVRRLLVAALRGLDADETIEVSTRLAAPPATRRPGTGNSGKATFR
jgi:1-acyl-sn-glycerol-3-phosphate acyltransferase